MCGLNWPSKKIMVDLAMTVALPFLMAHALMGETFHEWLGVVMFFLWIVHHILNRTWSKNLGKGPYTAARAAGMIVNGLLFADMLVMMVSGMLVSKHVFIFLPMDGGASFARTLHMVGAYWGFVLMSIHLGLHWNRVWNRIRKKCPPKAAFIVTVAISIYGGYAFVQQQVGTYLFLQNRFVFFDFSRPTVFFLADYLAMMVLFAAAGYFGMKAMRRFQ